ncbi:hypothetical protein LAZ67_14000281 [Cordylochernes scorpioides]|uniref:Uncharacterized protein n=1 Tax=Cordylochernes scorpioides TaxID=51811 RepID=A0ABY6L816_9ARAC|nr:hypothetical protein LAZ67_14000281 [Cordylochernes scorpioides]
MKIDNKLQTSVYYKPSFTPSYIKFSSFCPMKTFFCATWTFITPSYNFRSLLHISHYSLGVQPASYSQV